jgi:polyisoprenyl-phosphate glycosyltransferase
MTASMLSLVVPVLNEAGAVNNFVERVTPVLRKACGEQDYEIIFIDDGSKDATVAAILRCRERDAAVKLIILSRNFGKDIALSAGLEAASGAAVIPIDVDLQDPPEAILDLVQKWRDGFDIVYAVRADRTSDSFAKRKTADWFYRVFNRIADTPIPEHAGDFRVLDRRVVDALNALPERNRFMKGLYSWVGFKSAGVSVVRAARQEGESKWKYWRLWNFALSGIFGFSTAPLRIWSYVGASFAGLGLLYAAYLVLRVFVQGTDVPGYASLMVAVLFMGGLNLMTLGILGEYIGRIYTETKQRPLYLVRERIGLEELQPGRRPDNVAGLETLPRRATSSGQ